MYRPHVISNRHPFAPPALPGIDTTIGGSDFRILPPVSLLFTLVHGCPPPADQDADLLGYRAFSLSDSTWPGTPGSTGTARRGAIPIVACRRDKPVGTHLPNLSGLNTFKVGSTRYLYTSPAFAPTHRRTRYRSRRKARYWARGSRLPRWDSHPLDYATLPSRTVPNSSQLFSPARTRGLARPHCPQLFPCRSIGRSDLRICCASLRIFRRLPAKIRWCVRITRVYLLASQKNLR